MACAEKDYHKHAKIVAHLDPVLMDRVRALVAKSRPKTTITAVLTVALEEYLESVGAWPPPVEQWPPPLRAAGGEAEASPSAG